MANAGLGREIGKGCQMQDGNIKERDESLLHKEGEGEALSYRREFAYEDRCTNNHAMLRGRRYLGRFPGPRLGVTGRPDAYSCPGTVSLSGILCNPSSSSFVVFFFRSESTKESQEMVQRRLPLSMRSR